MTTTLETAPPRETGSSPKDSPPAPAAAKESRGLGQGDLLPPGAQRKLRSLLEEFSRSLTTRVSINFRLDFSVNVSGLQAISFQKFLERSGTPLHFTLFTLDPLPGVGLLEVPPQLGLNIVDRLLGGTGKVDNGARLLTQIETALLDQVTDVILAEWVTPWSVGRELRHTTLGHEIDTRFLNAMAREALVLEAGFEVALGECRERFRIGMPYASVEPIVQQLSGEAAPRGGSAKAAAAPLRWNTQLDGVPVKLTACGGEMQMMVQALASLKVGDVVPVDAQVFAQARLLVGEVPKFIGLLGTSEGRWAVQLSSKLEA